MTGAPARPDPAFARNLARRLATAAVVIPALLAALFLGPSWLVPAVVGVVILAGIWELHALLRARDLPPLRVAGVLSTAAVFVEVAWPHAVAAPLLPLAALLPLLAALGIGDPARAVPASALTLLGSAYLGGLGGTMAGLHALPPATEAPWRIVLLLGIMMAADSAAFFTGRALGRHRLAPSISPGKTVEGAIGGLLGGVAGALVVRALGLPALPLAHAAALGAGAAALGAAGDLFESLLKRWAGVKDSGRLFPGHGGMLDRLDSLLFGAPLLYAYFLLARP